MKTINISLCLMLLAFSSGYAQDKFYNFTITAGISPKQTPIQSGLIVDREDPVNEFIFNLAEIQKSYTFGFLKNIRFSSPFFGTIGLEYSQHQEIYSLSYRNRESRHVADDTLNTSSHRITLPAGVGVKLGGFDLTSGLHLHYDFKSTMKEDIASGIEMTKSKIRLGWYTGVGFSFARTRIGIQYQSSLGRYGNNLVHKQKSMELMSLPGNLMFTIGYSF